MSSVSGVYNADVGLSRLEYSWPSARHTYGTYETTTLLFFIMAAYSFLGSLFAWMAGKRLRQNVF